MAVIKSGADACSDAVSLVAVECVTIKSIAIVKMAMKILIEFPPTGMLFSSHSR